MAAAYRKPRQHGLEGMAGEGGAARGRVVPVLLPYPFAGPFDYRVPPEMEVAPGDIVLVPLNRRAEVGVVWDGAPEGTVGDNRLRPISGLVDAPAMRADVRQLVDWIAAYTVSPPGEVMAMALRINAARAEAPAQGWQAGDGVEGAKLTPARRRVLAVLGEGRMAGPALARAAEVSPGVVRGMADAGLLVPVALPVAVAFARPDPGHPGPVLSGEQEAAAAALRAAVRGGFSVSLLDGVTGSGKTEVYLEAIAECLRAGRQALVLLPEIALTAEFLTRVEARFGARPAEWHSGVTVTERRRIWRMVAEGGAQLVVGARSALFLPYRELGLIVVDEEHDTSYKQEDGVLYNARDMAVLRAAICGARVVLASATPSLESWTNAEAGKYDKLVLTSRFGAAVLPEMRAIDMRAESLPTNRWISPSLQAAVRQRIGLGEQALLFINRRGYAPTTVCRACGHQIGCDHCDARMVEHRFLKRLVCHQCGETKPMPEACPACGVSGKLAPVGPGVERLTEEAQALFPTARVATLSSDMYSSARALKAEIEGIAAGSADIIIGTQLVAKGHNFPLLTLVGVIDADLGLQGSDLRAAERTFQLMRQVAGRAGRAEKRGQALLQTHQPEHPVIRAILAGDEDGFWRAEADERRQAGVPPFGRMAGIIISSNDAQQAFELGTELARRDAPLRQIAAQVYGPAPAPIARIRGRHRVRLLVRAEKGAPLQAALARWLGQVRLTGSLRLAVDIDPQSFY